MTHLPCCAPGSLVQGAVYLPLRHQIRGEPGTLNALLHAQHCCSLGKIRRCDPGDTCLRQRLHCSATWRETRVFSPLCCTAADPVKSQLLQPVPMQSANASFLQSFAAWNSLNNPLNGCSSYMRVAVLAHAGDPSSPVSCFQRCP